MKALLHVLVLAASFGLVFIWEQTFLSTYTIQFLGAIIFFYLFLAFLRYRRSHNPKSFGGSIDIFTLNVVILLLTSLTGNLYSPLFFLLYFLGFGITFIFEPFTVFLFSIGAAAIFLPEVLKNNSLESFIRIGSLLLISPLAFFFGQEYKDKGQDEERNRILATTTQKATKRIRKDAAEVLQDEKENLSSKDVRRLHDIQSQSKKLTQDVKDNLEKK